MLYSKQNWLLNQTQTDQNRKLHNLHAPHTKPSLTVWQHSRLKAVQITKPPVFVKRTKENENSDMASKVPLTSRESVTYVSMTVNTSKWREKKGLTHIDNRIMRIFQNKVIKLWDYQHIVKCVSWAILKSDHTTVFMKTTAKSKVIWPTWLKPWKINRHKNGNRLLKKLSSDCGRIKINCEQLWQGTFWKPF
jgi:hypothetical protein